MKVKKHLSDHPITDVEVGDELNGFGVIKFIYKNREVIHFAYVDGYGDLETSSWDEDRSANITREVEKPDKVELKSLFGDKLILDNSLGVEPHEIQISFYDTETNESFHGRIFGVNELIDAIKAVKGMD